MSDKNFYITTPIYYVNGAPHLGHAYSTIACDVMARFKRLDGYDVHFLTGTDEHGIKVFQTARDQGVTPQELCDKHSQDFRDILPLLNITNDDFIRTTEDRHKKGAQAFWQKLADAGTIYKDSYSGWYAPRDEAYYDEGELIEKNGEKCAPTGAPVEWMEEESYFFNLSKWGDKLLEYFDKNPDFIQPASARSEVVAFVKGGLRDMSISRTSFDWGVPVPGDEKHVMYVWLDALSNYITALGYPDKSSDLMKFWPADIHLVGKDIMRFHCIYWPAFLMAACLPLPQKVFCTGWWTVDGEKMSKSLGNVLSPQDLVDKYGLDELRYVLFRMVRFGNDGDFDQTRAVDLINAFCANSLGNLAQRTLSFIHKNVGGVVPNSTVYSLGYKLNQDGSPLTDNDAAHPRAFVERSFNSTGDGKSIKEKMDHFQIDNALFDIDWYTSVLNQYIDKNAPWALRKEEKFEEMESVLYNICEGLRVIAIATQPFMPTKMNELLDLLAVPKDERLFKHIDSAYALKSGTALPAPQALFPRIELKKSE